MIGMGTVVNAAAILAGAALGLVLRQGLPDRWQETIMHAIGLSVTVIGIQMAMKTNNIIIVIISLVAGAIIGEYFDIDKALNRFGSWIGGKLTKGDKKNSAAAIIGQGFVATSLIYCVGAMAIVGSIQEGLTGDASTLYAKSILDGITAIIFAAVVVGGVGILIGFFLGVSGEKFKVEVDEREVAVTEALPGNNCGGCGYAGCSGLAAAIVKGEAPVNQCPVGGAPVAGRTCGAPHALGGPPDEVRSLPAASRSGRL